MWVRNGMTHGYEMTCYPEGYMLVYVMSKYIQNKQMSVEMNN